MRESFDLNSAIPNRSNTANGGAPHILVSSRARKSGPPVIAHVARRWMVVLAAGRHPLLFHAGKNARVERRRDCGDGHPELKRNLHRPLAGSLLSRAIQHTIGGLRVFGSLTVKICAVMSTS